MKVLKKFDEGEVEALRAEVGRLTIKVQAADRLAAAVDDFINRKVISSRSIVADARLDYGPPFSPVEVQETLQMVRLSARAEFEALKEKDRLRAHRYMELANYIASHCPEEVQDGDTAAAVAIRWHRRLTGPRDDVSKPAATAWQDGLALCDEILRMIDDMPDVYEGQMFAESVQGKVVSIREWIETNEEVTENQIEALENMQHGIGRWMR